VNYLAVLVGGGVGALVRYLVSVFIQKFVPNFPLGTMVINTTGAFLIGFLSIYLTEVIDAPPNIRLLLITGFLGGYTTFSTFTLEGIGLINNADYLKAFYYIVGTNVIGFLLVALGRFLGGLL
jgi:crcB protein